MKFCDKVKKERREKGLTQQQFADMLGVSLRTITNYEKGESYPKQREIYGKMAERLRYSALTLIICLPRTRNST